MAHSQTVPASANITAAPAEPLLLFPLARRAHGAVFAFARLAVLLILVLLVPPRNHHDQHRSVVKFDGAADHLRAEFGNQQIVALTMPLIPTPFHTAWATRRHRYSPIRGWVSDVWGALDGRIPPGLQLPTSHSLD